MPSRKVERGSPCSLPLLLFRKRRPTPSTSARSECVFVEKSTLRSERHLPQTPSAIVHGNASSFLLPQPRRPRTFSVLRLLTFGSSVASLTHTVTTCTSPGDAFRPAYKAKLLAQVSKTRSPAPAAPSSLRSNTPRTSHSDSAQSCPSTPTPVLGRIRMAGAPASSALQSRRPPSPADAPSEEELGGLADNDVALTRASVVRSRKPEKGHTSQVRCPCRHFPRPLSLNRFPRLPPSFDMETLNVVYVEEDPPTKPPIKRTPKAEMDSSNSLSADFLEDWVRPTFDKVLMPTVLDHYGGQEDPWTVDLETARHGCGTKKDAVRTGSSSIC